jgi:hypothetical protein
VPSIDYGAAPSEQALAKIYAVHIDSYVSITSRAMKYSFSDFPEGHIQHGLWSA